MLMRVTWKLSLPMMLQVACWRRPFGILQILQLPRRALYSTLTMLLADALKKIRGRRLPATATLHVALLHVLKTVLKVLVLSHTMQQVAL